MTTAQPPAAPDAGDTTVEGALVNDLACDGSLTVNGDIEGARVSVKNNLTVRGWIRAGAQVRAGGAAEVFGGIREAMLDARGPVTVGSIADGKVLGGAGCTVTHGVQDSDLSIIGGLTVTEGGIQGGTTVATDRIEACSLGGPASPSTGADGFDQPPRTTLVRIGTSVLRDVRLSDLGGQIQEVEEDLSRLEQIWLPMLDDAAEDSALSVDERRELHTKRDQIDRLRGRRAELIHERARLGKSNTRTSAAPVVIVEKRVYPGTDVRVWSNIARFDEEMAGPLRITPSFSMSERLTQLRAAVVDDVAPKSDDRAIPDAIPDAIPETDASGAL